MPQKGTLFINPRSGAKLPFAEAVELEDAARAANLEVIPLTPDVDVAVTIRQRLEAGQRLFAAAGGDGTVNAVMQPLVHTDGCLAVIPVGTYNHFARDLGIPLDWRSALDVALSGTTMQIDVGRANERFFLNNVSLGLYPELVARREERGREYPRWKARLYAMYMTFRRYPHVTIAVEADHHHELIRTHVFMVSNNSYDLSRLGINAPRTTLTEGRLSVYWLPHMPRVRLMKFAARFLAGRVKEISGFRAFRTRKIKVQSSRDHLHIGIDGEVAVVGVPLTIASVPHALLVKAPRV